MPEDPPLYHLALEKDLAKEDNASRTAKDRAFWEEQVAIGEPIYTDVTGRWKLEACRKKYGSPLLRAADREMDDLRVGRAIYHLEPEPTRRLMDYCCLLYTSGIWTREKYLRQRKRGSMGTCFPVLWADMDFNGSTECLV